MFVVVVGDLKRDCDDDKQQVIALLDELKNTYSDLTIVSAACTSGIGSFVRQRCIADHKKLEFNYVEFDVKVFAKLPHIKLQQVYMSRNPALTSIGDMFHIFPYGGDVGHIANLILLVKEAKLPLAIHKLNGSIEYFNYPEKINDSLKNKDVVSSQDLKSQLE